MTRGGGRRSRSRIVGNGVVAIAGAVGGLLVGVIASVIVWSLLWDDTGSEEPSIAALMLVATVVLPVATLAGIATALTVYRRRGH